MWLYQSEDDVWTVGFYTPNGEWKPESDHKTSEAAAKRVHYLNGGHDMVAIETAITNAAMYMKG